MVVFILEKVPVSVRQPRRSPASASMWLTSGQPYLARCRRFSRSPSSPPLSMIDRIKAGGAGIPRARVRVRNFPGQTTTDPDGTWFYFIPFGSHLGPPLQVTAEVNGAPAQTQTVQPTPGQTTSSSPTKRYLS